VPEFVITRTRVSLTSSNSSFYGAGRISGDVSVFGTPTPEPVRRRVRVHRQDNGAPLRETWSRASDGAYSFDDLPSTTVCVISFDHTGQYGGVIETDVTPEPMP
jgi:hypothetical protein